jgi:D-Tyr-tRNAtyr deacylase
MVATKLGIPRSRRHVETGVFGVRIQLELVNAEPVTITLMLDT